MRRVAWMMAAAWVGVGACSWSASAGDLSREGLLDLVPSLFEQVTGVRADRVDCPGKEDARQKVLDCVVTAAGVDVKVRVLVGRDAPGIPDDQNINITVTDRLVRGATQETGIRDSFAEKGLTLDTVTCPPLTKITALPVLLQCQASAQGIAIVIDARVSEHDSNYHVSRGVVDVDAVAEQIRAVATRRGMPGDVTCEGKLHVMVPNSSFLCSVGAQKLRIKLDGRGEVEPEPEFVP